MFDIVTNLQRLILVQTCKILVRNAKLSRISEEFCKVCDSCNLGYGHRCFEVIFRSTLYCFQTSKWLPRLRIKRKFFQRSVLNFLIFIDPVCQNQITRPRFVTDVKPNLLRTFCNSYKVDDLNCQLTQYCD